MDHYIYDDYEDGHDYFDYEDSGSEELNITPILDAMAECFYPSLQQIISFISVFLVWNGIFAVTTQLVRIPSKYQHLLAILCGIEVMYFTFEKMAVLHVLVYMFATVMVFKVPGIIGWSTKNSGYWVSAACVLMLIIQEFYATNAKRWHQIRGSLLITTMKLISLAFDTDASYTTKSSKKVSKYERPSLLETFGYLLSPANCILGPWISFKDYMASFEVSRIKWRGKWFMWIISNLVASVAFLLCSNCVFTSIFAQSRFKWIVAYRDATSFRFSHYFVSFLSQALVVLSSYSDNMENKRCISTRWGYLITNPLHIEFPRSLVDVVVMWNMSMHFWLKTYVFRIVRPFGTFTAVIATYAASAILHGLNFQLAAVLLSLGLFTYVEHKLRHKLANIFSACIAASACKDATSPCGHRNKWNEPHVLVCNVFLGAVAVMNLAYLGLMFEGAGELQEEGFSYVHTLSRWSSLDFLSHWLVGASYLFYRVI